jgi:hypothetical protein
VCGRRHCICRDDTLESAAIRKAMYKKVTKVEYLYGGERLNHSTNLKLPCNVVLEVRRLLALPKPQQQSQTLTQRRGSCSAQGGAAQRDGERE